MCERLSASVFEASKGFQLAIVEMSRHGIDESSGQLAVGGGFYAH